jgi:hypothetical protein
MPAVTHVEIKKYLVCIFIVYEKELHCSGKYKRTQRPLYINKIPGYYQFTF